MQFGKLQPFSFCLLTHVSISCLGEHCSTDGVNLGANEDPDFSNNSGAAAGVGRLQDGDKRPDAGAQDWAGERYDLHSSFPLFDWTPF